MSIGLLFWVLSILAVIGLFWTSQPTGPIGLKPYNWVFIFVLVLLLGWKVFGPALHQ